MSRKVLDSVGIDAELKWIFSGANSLMLFVPCDFQKERTGNAIVGVIKEFELELEFWLPRVQRRAPLTFCLYFL